MKSTILSNCVVLVVSVVLSVVLSIQFLILKFLLFLVFLGVVPRNSVVVVLFNCPARDILTYFFKISFSLALPKWFNIFIFCSLQALIFLLFRSCVSLKLFFCSLFSLTLFSVSFSNASLSFSYSFCHRYFYFLFIAGTDIFIISLLCVS